MVVGSVALAPDTNEVPQVIALAVALSVICIIIICPSTGVPVSEEDIEVIACASAVIWNISPLSELMAGVADCVVVTTLLFTRLLVSVSVEDIVTTFTPSTAIFQALTLDRDVSLTCHNSILPDVVIVVPAIALAVQVTAFVQVSILRIAGAIDISNEPLPTPDTNTVPIL